MLKNIETLKKTIEKWKKTMEHRRNNGRKPWNNWRKPWKNLWKSWTNQWKPCKLDKNHGTNSETSGTIDEQCEWEILATKCSKLDILAAKTKEGSLDDQKKKKCKKKCQLNSAPDIILYIFITYLYLFFHFSTPLNF